MKTYTNPTQIKSKFSQILTILLLAILVLNHTAQAKDLFVSDARDISDLDMTGIYIQETPRLPDFVDSDNRQRLSMQNIRMIPIIRYCGVLEGKFTVRIYRFQT